MRVETPVVVVICVVLASAACAAFFWVRTRGRDADSDYVPLGLRTLPTTRRATTTAPARAQSAAPPSRPPAQPNRRQQQQHDGGYRLEVAFRDAADGFNACAVCGFENFRRDQFCSLCAAAVVAEQLDSDSTLAAAPTPGGLSAPVIRAPEGDTRTPLSKRSQRVRTRREWRRRLDANGSLFWFRDNAVSGAANAVTALQRPGYTLQFKPTNGRSAPSDAAAALTATGRAPPQPPRHQPSRSRKPAALTVESVQATLDHEVASHALQVVEAAYSTPGELAVPCRDDTDEMQLNWAGVLQLAAQDFPTKYAHFVSTTAALIAPRASEFVTISVSRASVLPDSMQHLSVIPRKFVRSAMRIRFLDERGIDAGGLQREWFSLLSQQLASPTHGVFRCVNKAEQTFYLNPSSERDIGKDHLLYYYGAGRLLGRALLEEQVVGFHLALPLLKIALGVPVTFSDLEHLDPEAYQSLVWIRDNTGVDALGLTFSLTEEHTPQPSATQDTTATATTVVDLVEGGRDIDVTDANKHVYLELRFRYVLFESVSSQLYVFLKGLYEVIPQELLMLFDPEEFDYLLCGSDAIDVDDWEKHTTFTDNLRDHSARTWFWEIVREMPNEYRRRLLHFATGSSRVPIAGFSAMTSFDGQLSPFMLHGVPVQESEYVWGHACFNRLGLPLHESREVLKQALYSVLDLDVFGFTVE